MVSGRMKTRTDKLRTKLIWLAALVLLSPLAAKGATVNGTYMNGTIITQLFLWSANAPLDVTFTIVDPSDPSSDIPAGWNVVLPMPNDRLVVQGSGLTAGGDFDITFDYPGSTFRFEFAEVLYDSVNDIVTIQGTGKVHYNGKKFTGTPYTLSAAQITDINNHMATVAAVPIPSSVVLMMSAIGFMGIASRRTGASKADKQG